MTTDMIFFKKFTCMSCSRFLGLLIMKITSILKSKMVGRKWDEIHQTSFSNLFITYFIEKYVMKTDWNFDLYHIVYISHLSDADEVSG